MSYPYIPSGGILHQVVDQFKKSLPAKVDTATLKKLGIAPSNEGYAINLLRFLGVIDNENNKTPGGINLFTTHGEKEFAGALEVIVREKYSALFDLRGEDAWTLDRDALITFFRNTDRTSSIVGTRQATTFVTLSMVAAKRSEASKQPPASPSTKPKVRKSKVATPGRSNEHEKPNPGNASNTIQQPSNVGLTVRIEINLPANGSQSTYDNIFKSIRANLIDQ